MEKNMKTYSAKPEEIKREWHVIDAEGVVLGRMASKIAMLLRGKHKPMYTPSMDCGDHVIVINADKVKLTGKKLEKKYQWHTGYPGGLKERSVKATLAGRFPERVVENAVKRMMPKTKMGRQMFTKLNVYAGIEHPHEAQQPKVLDFAGANAKNKR
jgi:large subunit ribosomal protein L13